MGKHTQLYNAAAIFSPPAAIGDGGTQVIRNVDGVPVEVLRPLVLKQLGLAEWNYRVNMACRVAASRIRAGA